MASNQILIDEIIRTGYLPSISSRDLVDLAMIFAHWRERLGPTHHRYTITLEPTAF
jgi:hypothetical protein